MEVALPYITLILGLAFIIGFWESIERGLTFLTIICMIGCSICCAITLVESYDAGMKRATIDILKHNKPPFELKVDEDGNSKWVRVQPEKTKE